MRHKKIGRKFGRESHQRSALLRSLCSSLVKYERIQTTLAKAKDLRRMIEKAVTMAKQEGALKKPELYGFFHSSEDKEIVGRDAIKRYLSNLPKTVREKAEKYIENPTQNPKPDFIVELLTSDGERAKGPKILRVEGIMTKLVKRIAPRFKEQGGGYTRIFKLGKRRGDAAEMALIEFLPAGQVSEQPRQIGWKPCRTA
ncbi:MAG: LSU ribosomal protein L17p [Candidatus Ozemobacter sibiricus]|jgi:large subunit ribosomal protein L17|uniref:Large ribosomal subunit protein bL17 n=1 Tax=Candidatus Ozemobacter sibiricus TaxID=2268124 RepID=A0A367ZKY2_9BACT|nr:MAG: LSU ribosomal protein L17p [Candidatus Ozemobacter sibiricus]